MALKVNIINEQNFYHLPLKELCRFSKFVFKKEGCKNTEVSILFTGDKEIKKFNAKFRNKNKATDVLSFYQESSRTKALTAPYLGDVVISVETARRQAASLKKSIISEIRLYIIHGLLHLLGWSDYTKKDFLKLAERQEGLLKDYAKKNLG
ncbi:MAG: rRNA maturation RNase YbeY [Candidatus Omnitrophica bacterium]|nr:rRNA maturation RNase YbeY [Candidatus Omnitrophota bacterium]